MRIRLEGQHQARRLARPGQSKALVQPGDVGFGARPELGIVGGAVREVALRLRQAEGIAFYPVVVAARDVELQEDDAAMDEAGVLGEGRARRPLLLEREGAAPEAARPGEHRPAQMVEPLQRVVAAGLQVPAVGPFVVARHVDHRRLQAVEAGDGGGIGGIVAGDAAVLDVAIEDREGDLGAVDVGDQRRHLRRIVVAGIGQVAPGAEAEALGPGRQHPGRYRAGDEAGQQHSPQQATHPAPPSPSARPPAAPPGGAAPCASPRSTCCRRSRRRRCASPPPS